jgi:hypothetical protein
VVHLFSRRRHQDARIADLSFLKMVGDSVSVLGSLLPAKSD